jgi:hypothetical protein
MCLERQREFLEKTLKVLSQLRPVVAFNTITDQQLKCPYGPGSSWLMTRVPGIFLSFCGFLLDALRHVLFEEPILYGNVVFDRLIGNG